MWNLFNPLWWWNVIIDPLDELGYQKKTEDLTSKPNPKCRGTEVESLPSVNTVYRPATANNVVWADPVTVNDKKPRKKKKAVKIGDEVYVKDESLSKTATVPPDPVGHEPKKPVVKAPRKK